MTSEDLQQVKEFVTAAELANIDWLIRLIESGIARLEAENGLLPYEQPVDVEHFRVMRFRLLKLARDFKAGKVDQVQINAELESVRKYLREERAAP